MGKLLSISSEQIITGSSNRDVNTKSGSARARPCLYVCPLGPRSSPSAGRRAWLPSVNLRTLSVVSLAVICLCTELCALKSQRRSVHLLRYRYVTVTYVHKLEASGVRAERCLYAAGLAHVTGTFLPLLYPYISSHI